MAGKDDALSLPAVLAGPFITRVDASSMTLWMATSRVVDVRKLKGEVWDPLPPGVNGWVEPGRDAPPIAGLYHPRDFESRQVGKTLFVHRLRLRAFDAEWRRNRALAYRVAVDGVSFAVAPGGAEPLPGNPKKLVAPGTKVPPAPFPWAWFATDWLGERWAVLAVDARAPETWLAAESYLAKRCAGAQRKRTDTSPRDANTDRGRPTLGVVFAVDAVAVDEVAVATIAKLIAPDLKGPLPLTACRQLLAASPVLWQLLPKAPTNKAGVANEASAAALAKLRAHTPCYALPASGLFESTSKEADASRQVLAMFHLWGNAGSDPEASSVAAATRATTYATGSAPALQIFYGPPERLVHPASYFRPDAVLPRLFVATPEPVLPLARKPGASLPKLGSFDNLFALSTDALAYLTTPDGQLDQVNAKEDRSRAQLDPRTFQTLAKRRVYQLTASSAASPATPGARRGKAIVWNEQAGTYAFTTDAPMLATTPAFSVVSSNTLDLLPGVELAVFTHAEHGVGLRIARAGHRVMPRGDKAIYIGNRLRTSPETDDDKLGGVTVTIDGKPWRSKTTKDGRVPELLEALSTGTYRFAIAGPLTEEGPPGPKTPADEKAVRVWRRREFQIVVFEGRVIRVDDEELVSPGVRILVDPVYMRLVSGIGHEKSGVEKKRPGKVTLFVVHRPEQGVATSSVGKWQKAGSITAAPYLLTTDGTLLKQAPDSLIVNHAPGHWLSLESQSASVGVEITKWHDDPGPYTDAQYDHLIWLLGQYTLADVPPENVVGHSDVKDVGKDDPGLVFDWARLEAAGFGLRRMDESKNILPTLDGPYPDAYKRMRFDVGEASSFRDASSEWRAAMKEDLKKFDSLYEKQLKEKEPRRAVADQVRKHLYTIGYRQAGDKDVVEDAKEKHAHDPKNYPDGNAIAPETSFRSHFFAGRRRMLFEVLSATVKHKVTSKATGKDEWEEKDRERDTRQKQSEVGWMLPPKTADEELFKLTAVWAHEVATFMSNLPAPKPKVTDAPKPPR